MSGWRALASLEIIVYQPECRRVNERTLATVRLTCKGVEPLSKQQNLATFSLLDETLMALCAKCQLLLSVSDATSVLLSLQWGCYDGRVFFCVLWWMVTKSDMGKDILSMKSATVWRQRTALKVGG